MYPSCSRNASVCTAFLRHDTDSALERQRLHTPLALAVYAMLIGASALALSTTFSSTAHAASPAVQSAAEIRFDIPAGTLPDVVRQFAQQAGIDIAQAGELPADLLSAGLQDSYSVPAGLRVLLAGSGVRAIHSSGNQYLVRQAGPALEEDGVLAEVTVTAAASHERLMEAYAGGHVARGGQVGLLGNQDFMDTPFSTTAYTEAYIQDIQATDVGSVIGYTDASVYVPQTRGVQESFLMRGFSVGGLNDVSFNGLAGMAPVMRGSTEMLERVEVQKGPAAMLSGMAPDGSVGGTINLVPKRAGDAPLTRLTGTYESNSVLGLHADIGRRFGERKEFGVRVNGVMRNGDTAVHDQSHRMALGAVALDWRTERVRISADFYRQRERLDGVNYFGISTIAAAVTEMPSPLDGSHNLAAPWAYTINNTTTAMARAEWDLNDAVTAYAAFGRRVGTYDTLITGSSLLNNAGDISTVVNRQYYRQVARSGEAGLRAKLNTGAVKHEMSFAGTTYKAEYGATAARASAPLTNLHDLDYGASPDFSTFSRAKPEMLLRTQLNSLAIANRMSVLDERIQLTLGVRHQQVRSKPLTAYAQALAADYKESAWSPSAALLIKPSDQLALYGSYIQGLSQGETAPATAANAFEPLAPAKTKQYELGAKYDWGQVGASVALYQITKPSAYTDPVSNVYARSGEQRNRGVELNVFGQASQHLRLMGGLSYTQALLRKQLNQTNEGKQAAGVPKFIGRLGVEYDLTALPGVTVNGRLNQVGKRYATADNRLSAAAYTTFDLGARYATRIAGTPVTLRANLDNVFDKAYWSGTLGSGLGAPRTFMLSVMADF